MEPITDEGKTRPWMSFQTFWNFLEEVVSKPLPPKLDRSMMKSKSGTDQANLISALQLFGLIDESLRVQLVLETFQSADADGRKSMLGDWIRAQYAPALRVSAENGTPQDLTDVFRDELGMTGPDTRRKAITFFQHAAQHAGITLSPHFPKTRTGSGAPGAPRTKRTPTKRKLPKDDDKDNSQNAGKSSGHTQTVTLTSGGTVTLTYDVNMFEVSDEDEGFVLSLIKKLRNYPTVDVGSSTDPESGVP
jgi:hypothetical protein